MRLKIWRYRRALAEAGENADEDLAALYEAEASRLRRRLSRSANPDRAADLVQSAFLRLLRIGRARRDAVERPYAHLARVADNLAMDQSRRAEGRATFVAIEEQCDYPAAADFQVMLEARDILRRVDQAIHRLPDRTREIFLAHRFDDLTYAQIAARMGISVKTVEKHISLALRALHRASGGKP
ncbi:sigma-70 family RNA polymerase sigma factor [Novosphingobium sp. JCM 18896]|uniref:sigma-70 family RNA polymerase sigma factor n=1 Tax=Novosphingobium sp. JCM 18896 TaxID=2989731 RepID=UPI002223373D|nr:sigma-70 family RNA polymerase sigma factor [Novosphingobium sp. JCM 18896]